MMDHKKIEKLLPPLMINVNLTTDEKLEIYLDRHKQLNNLTKLEKKELKRLHKLNIKEICKDDDFLSTRKTDIVSLDLSINNRIDSLAIRYDFLSSLKEKKEKNPSKYIQQHEKQEEKIFKILTQLDNLIEKRRNLIRDDYKHLKKRKEWTFTMNLRVWYWICFHPLLMWVPFVISDIIFDWINYASDRVMFWYQFYIVGLPAIGLISLLFLGTDFGKDIDEFM